MKNLDSHKKALIAILIASFFAGGNAVFAKIALREISPLTFSFVRYLIASILILLLFFKQRPRFDKNFLKVFLVSSLSTANIIIFSFGVRLTAASIAQMIHSSVPILTVGFSLLLIREKITKKKLLGIIIGFIGTAIIIILPLINNGAQFKNNLFGNMMVFLGAIFFSIYGVLSKKLQVKYSPVQLTIAFCLTTVVITFPLALMEHGGTFNELLKLSNFAMFAVIYTSVFGAFIFYLLYHYAIKHGSALIASVSLYIIPVIAFGWAALLLGERLTIGFMIGAALAFTGAFIVTKRSKFLPPIE